MRSFLIFFRFLCVIICVDFLRLTLSNDLFELLEGGLSDGFDAAEGFEKIVAPLLADARDLIERLKALQEMSGEYRSFDGDETDRPGSVLFIIRTESIGE